MQSLRKKRSKELAKIVEGSWAIVDGFDTLFVDLLNSHEEFVPGKTEWVYKYELLSVPETESELRRLDYGGLE